MEIIPRRLTIDQQFDLDAILEGTQDCRWCPWKDDWHSGELSGNLIHIRHVGGGLEYRADTDRDDPRRSNCRLDEDIAAIRADLSDRGEKLARLMEKYPHLRGLAAAERTRCQGRTARRAT